MLAVKWLDGIHRQFIAGPDIWFPYRFTSQFKDDVKIPKGSVIELSREHDYVLRTKSKRSPLPHPHPRHSETSSFMALNS